MTSSILGGFLVNHNWPPPPCFFISVDSKGTLSCFRINPYGSVDSKESYRRVFRAFLQVLILNDLMRDGLASEPDEGVHQRRKAECSSCCVAEIAAPKKRKARALRPRSR